MASQFRAASRYAKSVFVLAQEQGLVEAVYADMEFIHKATSHHRELKLALNSPIIKDDKKKDILLAIFGDNISELTKHLIALIALKGRCNLIDDISVVFVKLYQDLKGLVAAKVTTAVPLDDTLRGQVMQAALKLAAGKTAVLTEVVDPAIMGGYILQIGDNQIDASVAGKFKTLHRELIDSNYVSKL